MLHDDRNTSTAMLRFRPRVQKFVALALRRSGNLPGRSGADRDGAGNATRAEDDQVSGATFFWRVPFRAGEEFQRLGKGGVVDRAALRFLPSFAEPLFLRIKGAVG